MDYILYEARAGVGLLTINRPRALNALNTQVLRELLSVVESVSSDDVRCLVITGSGEKSFVAGADIAEMSTMSESAALEFGRMGALVFRRIEELPMPVLAAVNGYALGGGCELAMACDIRVASENARFGQPEVKLGIIPGFSGTYRLAKLVGQGYAKEMIFSAAPINAAEALRVGLVNHVVAANELLDYVMTLAKKIVANAPIAVQLAKKSINDNYDLNKTDALALENTLFSQCFKTEDQKNGMQAFLDKKTPEFKNK